MSDTMPGPGPTLALGRLRPPLARPLNRPGLDRPILEIGDLADPFEPPPPPPPPDERPEPEPGFFHGGFSGETVLMVEEPPVRPGIPGSPPPPPSLREVGSLNLERSLFNVWNGLIQPNAKTQFESAIEEICSKDLPGSVRRLYRARAQINSATGGSLNLLVDPAHQRLSLFYFVEPEHELRCKADVKIFSDPTITIVFGLGMALSFATGDRPAPIQPPATSKCEEGPPPPIDPVRVDGSVWLRSAQIRVMGPRAKVSKGLDVKIAELFKGSIAQRVEDGLAGDSADVTTFGALMVGDLRDAMREAERRGHSIDDVHAFYDDENDRLQLRLRQPSPFDVQTDEVLNR